MPHHSLPLHNLSMNEAVATIGKWVTEGECKQVSFLNAHCVNVAQRDPDYRSSLQSSDLVLADGVGVKLAFRHQGGELKDNVNGTDLFPLLCRHLDQAGGARVFLLGGRPGIAEGVRNWIDERFQNLEVVGVSHGYFRDETALLNEIKDSGAQMVLVAMGVPLQETWITRHLAKLNAVTLGVGGLFDFFSGAQKRAPLWVRHLQMEWAYRLWREPARMWRRYLIGNIVFLTRLATIPRGRIGNPLLRVAESPSPYPA